MQLQALTSAPLTKELNEMYDLAAHCLYAVFLHSLLSVGEHSAEPCSTVVPFSHGGFAWGGLYRVPAAGQVLLWWEGLFP